MTHSLNEIEATAKRATRGAGLPWGLAEDAAKATRWLCSYGFDGVGKLADLLEQNDGLHVEDFAPVALADDVWRAPDGDLSPLISGAALGDCAVMLGEKGSITLEGVGHPLLLVPFLQVVCSRQDCAVSATWDGVKVVVGAGAISTQGAPEGLNTPRTDRLTVSLDAQIDTPQVGEIRAVVADADLQRLNTLAHRTFAPATEESRRLGAGGDILSDND